MRALGMILTNYTVQCVDQDSGKNGCFFFDIERWKKGDGFHAVGPVYPDLYEFYRATKPEDRKPLCEERYV